MLRRYGLIGALILATGCAGPAATSSAGASASSLTESAAPSESASPLVGQWSRIQDCEGMLAAFTEAGIAKSHAVWIVGNWVGDPKDVEVDPDDLCADARPAEAHSHFFTADGTFGSYDADGEQVDDGDYMIVDSDTVSFPSHSTEFGYTGDILVDFSVTGESATFEVQLPSDCTDDRCLEAHAWAISAFYGPHPWSRD
jgi:hypothetical protein